MPVTREDLGLISEPTAHGPHTHAHIHTDTHMYTQTYIWMYAHLCMHTSMTKQQRTPWSLPSWSRSALEAHCPLSPEEHVSSSLCSYVSLPSACPCAQHLPKSVQSVLLKAPTSSHTGVMHAGHSNTLVEHR